jgi:hypothetical protein
MAAPIMAIRASRVEHMIEPYGHHRKIVTALGPPPGWDFVIMYGGFEALAPGSPGSRPITQPDSAAISSAGPLAASHQRWPPEIAIAVGSSPVLMARPAVSGVQGDVGSLAAGCESHGDRVQ